MGLKVFFAILELLILGVGLYIFRKSEKVFRLQRGRGRRLRIRQSADDHGRSLVWVHAVIITALMIYEV